MSETIIASIISALAGGVIAIGVQWLRGVDSRHKVDSEAEIKIEAQRDGLTFQLLDTARSEMSDLLAEVRELRPLAKTGAHLEEALDHLHALLHSETDLERRAAERRATAFLRRLRGLDARGEERNSVQRAISGENIKRDAQGDQA